MLSSQTVRLNTKITKKISSLISNRLRPIFEVVNPVFYDLVIRFYNHRNKKQERILVYTDSRGTEATKFWNRRNPFSSYIGFLIKKYNCTVRTRPNKFTSLLDFIEYYDTNDGHLYDLVILHCGVVDFAPRPESSFDQMYKMKLQQIHKYQLDRYISKSNRTLGSLYEMEPTYSFLNEDALINSVIPLLIKMPNVLYIGLNRVLTDWDGNYWRKRPSNINEQLALDRILHERLPNTIDLSKLNDECIKSYTSDNIHFTKRGFDYLYSQLECYLPGGKVTCH